MTIKLESLQSNKGSRRKKMRKGRGIAAGQGASCGFGMRGQKSRSGKPTRPGFEGGQMPLYRRVPKLKHFPIVNLDLLVKEGILTKPKNPLKILGNGKLEVKLTVQAAAFTASAKKKIEEVGCSCELYN